MLCPTINGSELSAIVWLLTTAGASTPSIYNRVVDPLVVVATSPTVERRNTSWFAELNSSTHAPFCFDAITGTPPITFRLTHASTVKWSTTFNDEPDGPLTYPLLPSNDAAVSPSPANAPACPNDT